MEIEFGEGIQELAISVVDWFREREGCEPETIEQWMIVAAEYLRDAEQALKAHYQATYDEFVEYEAAVNAAEQLMREVEAQAVA